MSNDQVWVVIAANLIYLYCWGCNVYDRWQLSDKQIERRRERARRRESWNR